ncbi:SurA N-terminal domain-containing protein [Vallitalea okinawensis]|uniref:SurA N-terminal domain-containing protein n=1 Tax=Vallitalea okinawensis TaxID=2078660 RepID=UPI000CFDA821|nr:SurA N-terminal domain-containing protein [Vallitalea okinawensis]
MKILSKSKLIIIIVVFLIFGAVFNISSKQQFDLKELGKKNKEITNNLNKDKVIAEVNGIKIMNSDLEKQKNWYTAINREITDEEILEELISTKLLYSTAIEQGVKASDEEVQEIFIMNMDAIKNDPINYQIILDYIEGYGITEEEYWNLARKLYEESLIIRRYKDSIEAKFITTTGIAKTDTEYSEKYSAYYSEHLAELKENAKIKYK